MDIEEIIKGITALLGLMFGGKPPAWLLPTIGWIMAGVLLLMGIRLLLRLLKDIWKEFALPLFYNQDDQRRQLRRQLFADHVESEIRRLNNLEAWNDYRFAELEAEVEAEGETKWAGNGVLPTLFNNAQLRRERSLSVALQKSRQRLILLEGDPGSGKSVALRHIAQMMANKAHKSKNLKNVIPIYVNLKELKRLPDQIIDREFIKGFIFKVLNRVNDRDIEEFLDDEFEQGLQDGTWLFLFDSFDEIPDILSSTEADEVIRQYADAIRDFLYGMNRCRGIVASRDYRGPRRLGWPRFRILPLSAQRRELLIRRTGLPTKTQRVILWGLSSSISSFRSIASNPMFLGLLCEHLRSQDDPVFPEHTHAIFETYVQQRLSRDTERLQRRFNTSADDVRKAAETFAFCMASDVGLGLTPARDQLQASTQRLGLSLGSQFHNLADALEFLKLARSETVTTVGQPKSFTFAHRRFQEYFATCVIMKEPNRVSHETLLTNAKWRESAVVLLQTQNQETLQPLLAAAFQLLKAVNIQEEHVIAKKDHVDKTWLEEILDVKGMMTSIKCDVSMFFEEFISTFLDERVGVFEEYERVNLYLPFNWPKGTLHILSILQDGFSGHYDALPKGIQTFAGHLLMLASDTGIVADRRWALDVAGIMRQKPLVQLIESGFRSKSRWLKDSAYHQTSKLAQIPSSISRHIHNEIVNMALAGKLFAQRAESSAHLSRLNNPGSYRNTLRLMLWTPIIDHVLKIGMVVLLTSPFFDAPWRLLNPISEDQSFGTFIMSISIVFAFITLFPWWLRSADNDGLLVAFDFLCVIFGLVFAFVSPEFFFFIICFGWANGAVVCAQQGKFTHPIWWLFYPIGSALIALLILPVGFFLFFFAALGILGIIFIESLRIIISYKRTFFAMSKLKKVKVLCLVGIPLLIGYFVSGNWIINLLAVIELYFFIGIMIFWPSDIIKSIRGVRFYQAWRLHKPTTLSLSELLSCLESVRVSMLKTRVLRTIREEQLLLLTPGDLHHLRNLIVILNRSMHLSNDENYYRISVRLALYLQTTDSILFAWLGNTVNKVGKNIKSWDHDRLDELCKLYEQAKEPL